MTILNYYFIFFTLGQLFCTCLLIYMFICSLPFEILLIFMFGLNFLTRVVESFLKIFTRDFATSVDFFSFSEEPETNLFEFNFISTVISFVAESMLSRFKIVFLFKQPLTLCFESSICKSILAVGGWKLIELSQ